jgi:uncharacterized protein (DUF1697 family)
MTTQIALLRAVNVAGHQPVAMSDLRALLNGMGFQHVRTLLQSGNVVFEGEAEDGGALERRLEAEAKLKLGLETDFMVRSAVEWRAIIAANPFPEAARSDPAHHVVIALKDAPHEAAAASLREAIKGPETIELRGRELYVVYADGIGRSKLTIALIERRLGTRGTGRNWNTVLKLGEITRG